MAGIKLKTLVAAIEAGALLKQLADWCRTISAGAFVLGYLNPSLLGNSELMRKAIWTVGMPCLLLCLFLSFLANKAEAWKKAEA